MTRHSRQQDPTDDQRSVSGRQTAVALKYRADTMAAPQVVATGQGHLAEAILSKAFANDVKVRTDPDLAAILASLDVGDEIPVEAFAAVAEILTYLHRISGAHDASKSPGSSMGASDSTAFGDGTILENGQ